MIEAVVFDVGRVLFEWDLRHLFSKLVPEKAELDRILSEVVTEEWHFEHDRGRTLAEMTAERKALFPADAALIDAYAARFNETIPGPVPGSLEIVSELAEGGVPLFAITNFGAEFWDGFAPDQAVFEKFRDIVVSGREKLAKPDPAIFSLAERRFGLAPCAMLFIDDNAANIEAARPRGWQVHHFTGAANLRADLVRRGLLS